MYVVGDSLPIDTLPSGTYLLAGPAMSGKYELLLDVVAEGMIREEGGLVVSTNDDAESVVETMRERYDGTLDRLRLVDCVSEQQGGGQIAPERVEYVNSPADLTGLGIDVSEQLRRFVEEGVDGTRTGFHSVSTLLMYSDIETVFRFLHVLTGRIDGVDGLGLFTIDPSTHDEGTVNTVKQLFDGMLRIRQEGATREIQFLGIQDAPEGWVEFS